MPSASTKPENKASPEAGDPLKQVIVVLEKKLRNLEKRKVLIWFSYTKNRVQPKDVKNYVMMNMMKHDH